MLRREPKVNALIETRLRERLGSTSSDVIISTRPTLHYVAAEMTHGRVALIGWDHLNFPTRYGKPEDGVSCSTTSCRGWTRGSPSPSRTATTTWIGWANGRRASRSCQLLRLGGTRRAASS